MTDRIIKYETPDHVPAGPWIFSKETEPPKDGKWFLGVVFMTTDEGMWALVRTMLYFSGDDFTPPGFYSQQGKWGHVGPFSPDMWAELFSIEKPLGDKAMRLRHGEEKD